MIVDLDGRRPGTRYVAISLTGGSELRFSIPNYLTDEEVEERFRVAVAQFEEKGLRDAIYTQHVRLQVQTILQRVFGDLN